jgi:hypothetical protein
VRTIAARRSARPSRSVASAIRAAATADGSPWSEAGVAQVLVDGEVEVEREPLEDHAHRRQRLAAAGLQVEAAHGDAARGRRKQPGDQRHQRRLAGAVGAEQRREPAGGDGERHAVERLGSARVGVAHALDLECRRRLHMSTPLAADSGGSGHSAP